MTAKVTQEYIVTTITDMVCLHNKLLLAGYIRDMIKGCSTVPAYYALWSDGQVTCGDIPLDRDMAEVMADDFRSVPFNASTIVEPFKK